MTPEAERIARRMAAAGYLPSAAVLAGLGIRDREFVAIWAEVNHNTRPPRELVAEALLALAAEVTGEPHRRTSSALFALTQAVFDRGDVALPDAAVPRTLDVLRDVQRLDLAEDARSASVLDAAIRRLERRAIVAALPR